MHARLFFWRCKACLDRISTATLTLKSPGAPRILRVCTTPSLAMKWLIPRLADFQDWEEPGVEVQLSTVNSRFIEQANASNDVVILRAPLQRPEHTCVRFLDDYLLPVASPRFKRAARAFASPQTASVARCFRRFLGAAWMTGRTGLDWRGCR